MKVQLGDYEVVDEDVDYRVGREVESTRGLFFIV